MIHGKNHRPIRVQDSGSHGSKGPHVASNQRTKSLGMRGIDKRTRGRPLEQTGGGWAHLPVGRPPWSAEWARPPPTSSLGTKLSTSFLMLIQGAMCQAMGCKQAIELPL